MCETSNVSVVLGIFRTQDQHFEIFQFTQPLADHVELLGCSLFSLTHSLTHSLTLSLSPCETESVSFFHESTGYSCTCTYTSYNDGYFLLVLCLQTCLWFKTVFFQPRVSDTAGHGGAMRTIFGGRHYTRNSLKSFLPDQIIPLTWKLKIGRLKQRFLLETSIFRFQPLVCGSVRLFWDLKNWQMRSDSLLPPSTDAPKVRFYDQQQDFAVAIRSISSDSTCHVCCDVITDSLELKNELPWN